jgi:nucleoside-diphosphate-sugar epimerase
VRVLIAGCGYVGAALATELAAAGDEVLGLTRSGTGLPVGVTPVAADVTDPASLRGLPADLDAVVYAVAPDRRDEAAYRAAYVDGLANVLAAVGPVGRLVHVSSTAVHAQTDGSWVDEDSPAEPTGFRGRLLLAGERLAAEAGGTVLRLAGIYGPTRTRLPEQVRAGEATCPPTPTYTNRIHRDDAAGALTHLLRLDAPAPRYLGVDDDPADRCTVLTWLAEQLGAPPPRPGPASPRGSNKRLVNRRLRSSGYRLRHPSFRDGYGALLADA